MRFVDADRDHAWESTLIETVGRGASDAPVSHATPGIPPIGALAICWAGRPRDEISKSRV